MSSHEKQGHRLDHLLRDEHLALEAMFERLFATFEGGDCDAVRAAWQRLDTQLCAHLRDEEVLMLPGFARFDEKAAAKIREEHARIRFELERLGVDLDLKNLTRGQAESFLRTLREHAEYEERAFYPWIVQHASEEARHHALRRVLASLRPTREGEA